MKHYSLLCFVVPAIIISLSGFFYSRTCINTYNLPHHIQDTVEFSLIQDFTGDCETACYKFLGSRTVSKINGRPIEETCNHIFVKCPSNLKLRLDTPYRFVAIPFNPNNCSTVIDTCLKNKYYLLVGQIKWIADPLLSFITAAQACSLPAARQVQLCHHQYQSRNISPPPIYFPSPNKNLPVLLAYA